MARPSYSPLLQAQVKPRSCGIYLEKRTCLWVFQLAPQHVRLGGKRSTGRTISFWKLPAFKACISKGELVEWEEVYEGVFYGTLRTELERLWSEGKTVVFDVDVVGGLKLREALGDRALSVFVQPPSLEELRNRLEGRGTDSKERIDERMEKAEWEWKQNIHFDRILINTHLDEAFKEAADLVTDHLGLTLDHLTTPEE